MTDPRPDPEQTTADSGRLRRILLAVLTLAVLVAGAALAWTLLRADGGEAQREREDAMARAEQFVLRANNFGPDGLDDQGKLTDYRKLVEEVVTAKFQKTFAQGVPVNEARAAQLGQSSVGDVYDMGVARLDDDAATVLVTGGINETYAPPAGAGTKRVEPTYSQFRIQVELRKVDGEWLVDAFTPLQEA